MARPRGMADEKPADAKPAAAKPAQAAEQKPTSMHSIPCVHVPWHPGLPYEPNDEVMAEVQDEKMLVDAMRHWFLSRYCDPAVETPYTKEGGGYIWIWGGPYDPGEELRKRFGDFVDDSLIEGLARELRLDGGFEWARIRASDDFDQRFDIDVDSSEAPLGKLKERLAKIEKILELNGDEEAMELAPSLAFGSVISALEAYLFETAMYWVAHDNRVLRGIVTGLPGMRDQPMKLGDIFQKYEGLENQVKGYLQNLVWHRWDTVAPLYTCAFGFKPPSFRPFEAAILKRHDIVHRSGHDRDGNQVSVSRDDARRLAQEVLNFCSELYSKILERPAGEPARTA